MEEYTSLSTLKTLVEKKIKRKVLVKVMWNETEKITLFITPNMKINSFIFDQKDGYLFYDNEGKLVEKTIPCILPEENLVDGKVALEGSKGGKIRINGEHLSNEDIAFLTS
ncbi:hypothetical protein [Oceanobacillus bengalensis]|uniref:Uncharacterized protein n=1 Tax=Oceanobacillus bengalensis TaxID=1435466 RepID=A0A494Z7N1_9BACI|nr:hypothetical protein [Oceanobacillus bengalensis]RKQ18604.1 hypothetical protein D8M05_00370 [Oceanobacillus bengalensis]